VALLDQHGAEPRGGGVTLHDEQLGEVGHGEHWGGRHGGLKRCERRG
jgi:hypothetical protein